MTVTESIIQGFRAARRHWWVVLLFYAANLILAAALAAPMHTAIADHLGKSKMAEDLVRGFDSSWLLEFQLDNSVFLKSFSTMLAFAGILFLALNTVLSAGAFEVFAQHLAPMRPGNRPQLTMQDFGRGIGRHTWKFARLVLAGSILYFIVFWFWQGPVARLLESVSANWVAERPFLYLDWLRWALLGFCVLVVNAIIEFAKADIVIDNHASALGALGHAAGFIVRRFARVAMLWLGMAVLSAVVILAYGAFASYFPQNSALTIFVWFVVAQVLMFLRWMIRLSAWGAAVAFYGVRQHATDVAEPVVEPV